MPGDAHRLSAKVKNCTINVNLSEGAGLKMFTPIHLKLQCVYLSSLPCRCDDIKMRSV